MTAGNPCKKPCKWGRRGGCGYYAADSANAEQGANEAEAELAYIAHDSAEAKAMQAQQEQAVAELAEDILAIESIQA